MSKGSVQVGLVGLGRLGKIYADHLAGTIPETRLVAVADPDPEALRYAERWASVKRFGKAEELIAEPAVEAIVIVSPTHTHRPVAELALLSGKPVFCEKPLSVTLHDSLAIETAVSESGSLFQMGFMRRFDPGYAAAQKKMQEGTVGRPALFKSSSRDPSRPSLDYLKPESSGGIFVDMGIHDFDLALWMMGPVQEVFSTGGILVYPEMESIGDIDNAVVSLVFESGALGVVDLSRNGCYGYDIQTEILGSEGTLRIGYLRETPLRVLKPNSVWHDTVPYFPERFAQAYRLQLRNFGQNILEQGNPPIQVEDGVAALRVALAARKSFETGRSVRPSDIVD